MFAQGCTRSHACLLPLVTENQPLFHTEVFSKRGAPEIRWFTFRFTFLTCEIGGCPICLCQQPFCPCIEQPEPSAHKDCHGSTSPDWETTKWLPAKEPKNTRWEKIDENCVASQRSQRPMGLKLGSLKSSRSSPDPRHSSISSVADPHNLKVHVRSAGQLCKFLLDPFLPHLRVS